MTAPRMPASVTVSLALHAGALALFLGMSKATPEQAAAIVEGVDLLIAAPRPQQAAAPKPQMSTMDFLKLALPTRSASQQAMTLKLPESRKPLELAAPKLDERARRDLPKLEALDMGRERRVDAAKLETKLVDRRSAAATLAAMPRLEEVGRRRVKDLPQALALEERRQQAVSAAGIAPVGSLAAPSRRQAGAAMAALDEASPAPAAPARGLASLLPEARLDMGRPAPAPAMKLAPVAETPKPARREAAAAAAAGERKGVEIEGPLADRKVAAYAVPAFPDWARAQGILEAEVAIRFNVNAEGAVLPDMRVERTSGYGRLDKLSMESLRSWRFVPKPGAGVQWGVITFRFVLE
ncbi:MAG: TonB family protein [Elusimicrobiota bacterium]|nr:TonB family protein [Elusimicrobiota bacterium]